MMRPSRRLAIILVWAILVVLLVPTVAFASGEINYYIVCDPYHYTDRSVEGQVYYYGTYPYVSHVVRSLYLDGARHQLNTYVEVGQIYYGGLYTPTKHFAAYEDYGYTSSQVLYTAGNCSSGTWYNYFVDQNYPSVNQYKVGRDGTTWRTLTVHMTGGNPESSMERSSAADDGHGSYQSLQYKGQGPTVWNSWNAFYVWDVDSAYKAVKRSNTSWYSTPQ
jgi:hypothetical protein